MKQLILLSMLTAVSLGPRVAAQQGRADNPPAPTRADYERAQGLREKYTALAVDVPETAEWIGRSNRFYYRKSVKGGSQFVIVDAATQQKQPAFDHTRLAATLSKNTGNSYTETTLPFSTLTFSDDEKSIDVTVDQDRWRCTLADYTCRTNNPPAPAQGNLRGVNGPVREWPNTQESARPRVSPDGKWEAIVLNYNLAIRPVGGGKAAVVTATAPKPTTTTGVRAVVARLVEARRLSRQGRASPLRALRRVVAGRSAAAEVVADALRQARRPARSRAAGDVRSRLRQGDADRQRSLSQSLRPVGAGVAQGRPRLHLRIQPARTSGVPRHRSGRRHRRSARGDLGRAEDLLLLQPGRQQLSGRQALSLRPERRPRNRLDVGTRRLEPSLSDRRRDRRGEEPDHQGRVGGARRREGGRRQASDLVQRQRHVSGQGSVLLPLLPHQLRRHRPDAADDGGRESRGQVLARHAVLRRRLLARRHGAGQRAAQDERRIARRRDRTRQHQRAHGVHVEGARGLRRQGPRRQDRHLGRHLQADEVRSVEEVSGDRKHLRRTARLVRAQDLQRLQRHAGPGRARLHRRADRRHGHVESIEGVPRRRVAEHRRRRLPRSHPVAQGRRREVSVVRHHARRHLRRIGRRAELARRAALPSRVLQGRGLLRRLPRQPHGQDLVERAVDGMADRSAVLGLVQRRQRVSTAGRRAADRRRARHQRRSVIDDAGREGADQGEQEFRSARRARSESQRRPRRRVRRVRRAQALRLLRAAPDGRRSRQTGTATRRPRPREPRVDGVRQGADRWPRQRRNPRAPDWPCTSA